MKPCAYIELAVDRSEADIYTKSEQGIAGPSAETLKSALEGMSLEVDVAVHVIDSVGSSEKPYVEVLVARNPNCPSLAPRLLLTLGTVAMGLIAAGVFREIELSQ